MPSPRIVIVGGGAMGSAIACFLALHRTGKPWPGLVEPDDVRPFDADIVVVERDPSGAQASSSLSASSIRMQFSTPVNIELSAYGIDFLRRLGSQLHVSGHAPPDAGLVEGGYLYLAATLEGADALRANHDLQRARGADVALCSPTELRARLPWLHADDLELGSLGLSGEGWFDAHSLLQALCRQARALGARWVHAPATGLDVERRNGAAHVRAVRLEDGSTIACDALVNAAGPWAASVAAWVGIDLPVVGKRRTVFHVTSPARLPGCPLVIDPSGVWLRPEGEGWLCGSTPQADNDADFAPLDQPDLDAFDTVVWPALAHRIPAFEALRVRRAWAGWYEMNTFDHNGVVGLHPGCDNLVFANGFSGHGLQHAPGVGRGVAELIVHGAWRSIDLSALSPQRLVEGRRLLESNVI